MAFKSTILGSKLLQKLASGPSTKPTRQYVYSKLDNPTTDIRLVTIISGGFNDDIRVKITHASLIASPNHPRPLMSRDALQASLPDNWTVQETTGGSFMFENNVTGQKTWDHPIEDFDRALYERPYDSGFDPPYEALSYTWGSPRSPNAIFVENISGDDPQQLSALSVGRNLAQALRQLRYADKTRTLWIDAVCINQNDINERNEQVRRMADIYRLAKRVVVWLGAEAEQSTLAMTTLAHLGHQVVAVRGAGREAAPEASETTWFSNDVDLPYTKQQWKSIMALLNRAWFTRLWIWQEIQLANVHSVVQCGPSEIPWVKLCRSLSCLEGKAVLPEPNLRRTINNLRCFLGHRRMVHFRDIVEWSRIRECSDPRDKIYAILGIVEPELSREIVPDYGMHLSDVYKNAFLADLRVTHRLEVLRHCDYKPLPNCPSWVPNWSRRKAFRSFEECFFAGGHSRSEARYIPPNVLQVTGVLCAFVESVDLFAPGGLKGARGVMSQTMKSRNGSYVTGESLEDAVAATLCANMTAERFDNVPGLLSLNSWKDMLSNLGGNQEKNTSDFFVSHVMNYTLRNAWIYTSEGYFGIGPSKTRRGDVLCVLLGCSMPVVLRPVGGGQYRLLGDAYVHGLCDCEALVGQIEDPWKITVGVNSDTEYKPIYHNYDTGMTVDEDPRLGPLPPDWAAVPVEKGQARSSPSQVFKNTSSGEEMDSDPRLLPEALKARGVKLEIFHLA